MCRCCSFVSLCAKAIYLLACITIHLSCDHRRQSESMSRVQQYFRWRSQCLNRRLSSSREHSVLGSIRCDRVTHSIAAVVASFHITAIFLSFGGSFFCCLIFIYKINCARTRNTFERSIYSPKCGARTMCLRRAVVSGLSDKSRFTGIEWINRFAMQRKFGVRKCIWICSGNSRTKW